MTALPQYDLLEAEGLYFEGESAAPREVIVKFGDASLMILDAHDMPVTHWPLATLRNVATDGATLTFSPDRAGRERLSVDDPTMLEALRAVCPDLNILNAAPSNRRRKLAIWGVSLVLLLYLVLFHLIPALTDQMAARIPPDAEIAMGETMSGQFARLITGFDDPKFCATPEGTRALTRLTARLEVAAAAHVPLIVNVVDHKAPNALGLPGGQIILTSGLLALADTPEEVAGILAHEIAHVVRHDATRLTLRSTGFAGFRDVLLGDFTGAGATDALSKALIDTGYDADVEAAADVFAADLLAQQGLPTTPLATAFLKFGELPRKASTQLSHLASQGDPKTRAAIVGNADTIGAEPFEPALSDQQWVALRGICR